MATKQKAVETGNSSARPNTAWWPSMFQYASSINAVPLSRLVSMRSAKLKVAAKPESCDDQFV